MHGFVLPGLNITQDSQQNNSKYRQHTVMREFRTNSLHRYSVNLILQKTCKQHKSEFLESVHSKPITDGQGLFCPCSDKPRPEGSMHALAQGCHPPFDALIIWKRRWGTEKSDAFAAF